MNESAAEPVSSTIIMNLTTYTTGRMRTISENLHVHMAHQIRPPSLHISWDIRHETRGCTVLHSTQ